MVDGFVLVGATGIAVRAIGPVWPTRHTDPAVVCVDDAGRWAVALTGGHAGGANDLAREVAGLLGAEPSSPPPPTAPACPASTTFPAFAPRATSPA